jgi:predicted amidohydrolase
MKNVKVTVASLKSVLIDPQKNLARVNLACKQAVRDGARMLLLPELMLTGHGGHPKMIESAEPVPDGPLTRSMIDMSREADLCLCVGIAELDHDIVYNSMAVFDRGRYLGLQRKIHMSSDEYLWFGVGEEISLFDIDDVRFGIIICFDNMFPELALACALQGAELILAPHAARVGVWPEDVDAAFKEQTIQGFQDDWQRLHAARAADHNLFVLLSNAAGSSVEGLAALHDYEPVGPSGIDVRNVIANHAGTVMGFDPSGDTILRTTMDDFVDEIATVELEASKRQVNHRPTMNRRIDTMLSILSEAT